MVVTLHNQNTFAPGATQAHSEFSESAGPPAPEDFGPHRALASSQHIVVHAPASPRRDQTGTVPVPSIDVFRLRCECRVLLVDACLMDLVEAVDGLQAAAIHYGLVKEIGQDRVQAIMAEAFRRMQ